MRDTNLSPGWHHQDILAAVRKTGTSLRALSLQHGFGASTLQASLYKLHPRAHAIIARSIGQRCHALWPHWYDEADRPRHLTPYQRIALSRGKTRRAA
ncbi:helix-turn-helix domain-containing protein [Camelimonas lactis]